MTDQELINGIRKRDRETLRYLVTRYQQEVIRTSFHFTGVMADAEDLSQEVFMEVIRSAETFRGRASFSTWLRRITINKALNHLKRQKRRSLVTWIETAFGNTAHHQSRVTEPVVSGDQAEREEDRRLLHQAIGRLPENQRIAFVLSRFDERSHREISEIMSVSISAVESLIHRAKTNLQHMLIHHFSEYRKE